MIGRTFTASLVLSAALTAPAHAELLRYTLTGTASGSLNGVRFQATPVTISGVADSSSVVTSFYEFGVPGPTFSTVPRQGGSVVLSGTSISAPAAFGTLNWSPLTVSYTELFSGYIFRFGTLMQSIQMPFFGGFSVRLAQPGSQSFIPTSGAFTDSGPFNQQIEFGWQPLFAQTLTASLSITAVPEPSTALAVLSGLLLLGVALRRR